MLRSLGIAAVVAVLLAPPVAMLSGSARSQAAPELTIYSSLPLQGAARPQALAIVRGARLALDERGRHAGGYRIRYVSLDDSTSSAGAWTPEATAANAR